MPYKIDEEVKQFPLRIFKDLSVQNWKDDVKALNQIDSQQEEDKNDSKNINAMKIKRNI